MKYCKLYQILLMIQSGRPNPKEGMAFPRCDARRGRPAHGRAVAVPEHPVQRLAQGEGDQQHRGEAEQEVRPVAPDVVEVQDVHLPGASV